MSVWGRINLVPKRIADVRIPVRKHDLIPGFEEVASYFEICRQEPIGIVGHAETETFGQNGGEDRESDEFGDIPDDLRCRLWG